MKNMRFMNVASRMRNQNEKDSQYDNPFEGRKKSKFQFDDEELEEMNKNKGYGADVLNMKHAKYEGNRHYRMTKEEMKAKILHKKRAMDSLSKENEQVRGLAEYKGIMEEEQNLTSLFQSTNDMMEDQL